MTFKGESQPALDAAQEAGAVRLNVGLFLHAVTSFLTVGFAIFWAVRALSRFEAKEAEAPAALSQTQQTLVGIRDLLLHNPRP